MKNLKVNQRKIEKEKKSKASKFICTLVLLLLVSFASAQSWPHLGAGHGYDRWTVNDDNSNHWSFLRLQVGNEQAWNMINESFLWWGYDSTGDHGSLGARRMALTNDGKLGVGDIVPLHNLHVKGISSQSNPVILIDPLNWASGQGNYGEVRFGDEHHYIRAEHSIGMTINDFNGIKFRTEDKLRMVLLQNGNFGLGGMIDPIIDFAIGDHDTGFNQNGDGELGLYTNNTERIRIDNTGNVGIGTVDPSEKLQVYGNIRLEGDLDLEHNKNIRSEGIMNIQADDDNSGDGIIHFKAGTDTRMTMLDNGNLGIGTVNPTEKLQVAGTIKAQSVIASASSFPDYVFEDDYTILPLQELEAFVKEHKHLPNMPSEATIVENGLDVSDILTRSVENIETLYLHMIELQKELQQLKKDNESLRSELRRKRH